MKNVYAYPYKTGSLTEQDLVEIIPNLRNNKCIIFTNSITLSKYISEVLNNNSIQSTYVYAAMTDSERRKAISRLNEGNFTVCNAHLFDNGLDFSDTDVVVLVRRVTPDLFHRVQEGSGKVIDCCNNWQEYGINR